MLLFLSAASLLALDIFSDAETLEVSSPYFSSCLTLASLSAFKASTTPLLANAPPSRINLAYSLGVILVGEKVVTSPKSFSLLPKSKAFSVDNSKNSDNHSFSKVRFRGPPASTLSTYSAHLPLPPTPVTVIRSFTASISPPPLFLTYSFTFST